MLINLCRDLSIKRKSKTLEREGIAKLKFVTCESMFRPPPSPSDLARSACSLFSLVHCVL